MSHVASTPASSTTSIAVPAKSPFDAIRRGIPGVIAWLVAALGAVGGVVLGRFWGRVEGERAGKREAERDAMEDKNNRVERGRDAVRDGRGAGDPVDRLRHNDGRW